MYKHITFVFVKYVKKVKYWRLFNADKRFNSLNI